MILNLQPKVFSFRGMSLGLSIESRHLSIVIQHAQERLVVGADQQLVAPLGVGPGLV